MGSAVSSPHPGPTPSSRPLSQHLSHLPNRSHPQRPCYARVGGQPHPGRLWAGDGGQACGTPPPPQAPQKWGDGADEGPPAALGKGHASHCGVSGLSVPWPLRAPLPPREPHGGPRCTWVSGQVPLDACGHLDPTAGQPVPACFVGISSPPHPQGQSAGPVDSAFADSARACVSSTRAVHRVGLPVPTAVPSGGPGP